MQNQSATRYDAIAHLLSRVGLLALASGLEAEAERIFNHQRRVLADPAALEIARAIVMLECGRPPEAVRILQETVLATDPAHDAANVIYGIALRDAGLPGVRKCFETVLAISLDPALRESALAELELADA